MQRIATGLILNCEHNGMSDIKLKTFVDQTETCIS